MPRLRLVTVYRKPIIPIMSTGNEIARLQDTVDLSAGGEVGKGDWKSILDINRPSPQTVLERIGYPVVDLGIITDEYGSCLLIQIIHLTANLVWRAISL